uniref:DUF19 domain-containing protein n=1 Tax=Strigamia maritima TaxID=126957 RepID=T1IM32_STRMM
MIVFILGVFFFGFATCMQMCPQEDLEQCLRLADPFIQDEKFVFPVSIMEIQSMCMAWDTLTACVKNFVLRCMTSDKQQEFDIAVKESEDSMQQMCQDPRYQAEYLQNANCIKSVSVKQQRCGEKYIKLVSEVATKLNYDTLCWQSELIDDCPQGSTTRDNSNNLDNLPNSLDTSSRNQAGTGIGPQRPTFLAPTMTPQPTARWTYDPQNIGGIEPESWQDYNNECSQHFSFQLQILIVLSVVSYYFCS